MTCGIKDMKILFIILLCLIVVLVRRVDSETYYEIRKKWEFISPMLIDSIYIKDLNSDDLKEILIVGKNRNPHLSDGLYLLDWNGNLTWKKEIDNILDVYVSDIDYDQEFEIIVSCGKVRGCTHWGKIYIINLDGDTIFEYPKMGAGYNIPLLDIVTIDLDNNNREEIIGSVGKGVYAMDDMYGKFMWKWNAEKHIDTIIIKDVEGDGIPDVVAIAPNEIFIIAYNGTEKWSYMAPNEIIDVEIGSIHQIGKNDIVIALPSEIRILDVSGNLWRRIEINSTINSILIKDINDDSHNEIVVGTENGLYIFYMDKNETILYRTPSPINKFIVSKLESGGEKYVIFSIDDGIYAINSIGIAKYIYSPSKIGLQDEICDLYINDIDSNGVSDILIISRNKISVIEPAYMDIEEINEKKSRANQYYMRAYFYLNLEDYENAIRFAKMALSLYEEINYTEGMEKCNELIRKINIKTVTTTSTTTTSTTTSTTKPEEEKYENSFIGMIILILIVIFIIYKDYKRKSREDERISYKFGEG
ncbi:MAG: hypothetical protein DRO94_03525 [Candidatus Altiarchaeales archaeon]|nr:MAG: hypothetical protein DRO95_05435 [Candidatus Altiarchaeales archaeon]RLI94174.1 MAG: hypothetical protein DRO94_03525 [Candidatus Altiarchaeales archaeon]